MKYIFISSGTDNGKPFSSLEEAMGYLYQQARHSRIHLDGVLKDMKVSEKAFTLYIEQYDYFRGRAIEEMGIQIASKDDVEKIKTYFEINGLWMY